MKNNKGITLITLSITVVLMLILTTVISTGLNSFMETQKKSKFESDMKSLSEAVTQYFGGNKKLPVLDEFTGSLYNIEKAGELNPRDSNNPYYYLDLSGMYIANLNYGNKKDGNDQDVYIINSGSQQIYYLDGISYDGKTHYTILDNQVVASSTVFLKSVAKVGDYVAYNPREGVSDQTLLGYTSYAGSMAKGTANGVTADSTESDYSLINNLASESANGYGKGNDLTYVQRFEVDNTADSEKWRVLKIKDGQVYIVKDTPMRQQFSLRGRIGWVNATKEINNVAAIYGHGKYAVSARSLTEEDIIEIGGYQNPMYTPYIVNGLKLPILQQDGFVTNTTDGKTGIESVGAMTHQLTVDSEEGQFVKRDSNGRTTAEYSVLFQYGSGDYFIPSIFSVVTPGSKIGYYVRTVEGQSYTGKVLSEMGNTTMTYVATSHVRPVVILDERVTVLNDKTNDLNAGTESDPYEISILR